jgi:uracil-DNA glycosylase family 4
MRVFEAARGCRRCPRVNGCAVLGPDNGPVPARLLFIGEAPGRLGAGRTGVPFSGDEAGRRFERLLSAAGLARADIFVTNAVLCLPLDAAGRNRTPLRSELVNCSTHLSATIALVDPEVVVTLGATALAAIARVEPHNLALATAVARPTAWWGRTLIPLYHTGQRAQIHRSWSAQLTDWQTLGESLSCRGTEIAETEQETIPGNARSSRHWGRELPVLSTED